VSHISSHDCYEDDLGPISQEELSLHSRGQSNGRSPSCCKTKPAAHAFYFFAFSVPQHVAEPATTAAYGDRRGSRRSRLAALPRPHIELPGIRRGVSAATVRSMPPNTLASSPCPRLAFRHPSRRDTPDTAAKTAIAAPHCQAPGKARRSPETTQLVPCRIHHTSESAALMADSARPTRAALLCRGVVNVVRVSPVSETSGREPSPRDGVVNSRE